MNFNNLEKSINSFTQEPFRFKERCKVVLMKLNNNALYTGK